MRTPSSTSASKNLPPSCCVRESAPKPASQICCAESITPRLKRCPDVAASFAALKGSVLSFIGGISGLWKPNVRQPAPDFMDAGSDGDSCRPAARVVYRLHGPATGEMDRGQSCGA